MNRINITIVIGLSIWIFGFILMIAGWLVEVLFEGFGELPGKILYKIGAFIVAVPIMILLYKAAAALYSNRMEIAMFISNLARMTADLSKMF